MRRPAALLTSLALLLVAGVVLVRRRGKRPNPLPEPPPAPLALPPGPRFVSVPWSLVEAPGDHPHLTIRYSSSTHLVLDRIDAQETPTQVFVTVLMRWSPPAGGPSASQDEQEATVALSGPLGSRELIHAPVDDDGGPALPPLYP